MRRQQTPTVKYLLDTGWVVELLRAKPAHRRALEKMGRDAATISTITVAELYGRAYGARNRGRALAQVKDLMEQSGVLPLDDETCELFGRLRAELYHAGTAVEAMDLLIAATAMRHGLELVTNNVKHFQKVPGLRLWQGEAQ